MGPLTPFNTRNARRALKSAACAVVLTTLTLPLASCEYPRIRGGGIKARLTAKQLAHSVEINGIPITVGQFTAVDVENPWGDVEIRAASRNEFAMIEFRVRKERWIRFQMARQGIPFDPVGEYFEASYIQPEGSLNQVGTLVIRPTDLTVDGFRPPVDLVVTIPRCDGARVRTTRGTVEVTGVTGTIDIRNGDDLTPGGKIIIKSGERPLEEVFAFTSQGDIHLIASPDNTGIFDLEAPRGDAIFKSRFGYIDESMPERGRWTGIWNDGTNAINLRTEDGDASVFVTEQPRFYKP